MFVLCIRVSMLLRIQDTKIVMNLRHLFVVLARKMGPCFVGSLVMVLCQRELA